MKLSNLRKEVKKENKARLLKNIEAIKNLTNEDMKKNYGVFKRTRQVYKNNRFLRNRRTRRRNA